MSFQRARATVALAALVALAVACTPPDGGGGPPANNPPTPAFTATPPSGPAPLAVVFDGSGSTDSDGTIAAYSWAFGDGGTASGVATSHTYAPGTYTAVLTVTDNLGATNSLSQTIVATNAAPTAAFTPSTTTGVAPLPVSFDASASSDPDGTIVSYDWAFGDGGTGSGLNTSHTFDNGTFAVVLTVTDNYGLTATTSETITVSNPGPTAAMNATPSNGPGPLAVSFDGTGSSDANGAIVSYDWAFGDGGTASGATTSHTYAVGTWTATLTVTDEDGATDTTTTTITATNDMPIAAFTRTPASGTAPLSVSFNGSTSSDPDGSIVSYAWDFGDGGTGSGVSTSHSYAVGNWTATLTVTDNNGATASTTLPVTVTNALPTASFTTTPSSGNAPLSVAVDASASSDPNGTIVSYGWNFGDGGTASGVTANHVFGVGTFTITLTVTDNHGGTATTTRSVTSNNVAPIASFTATPSSGAAPLNVSLNASGSSDSSGTITGYAWNFGDFSSGSGVTTSHSFVPGVFTVTLTVTDSYGASSQTTRTVSVTGSPAAPTGLHLTGSGCCDTYGDYAWNMVPGADAYEINMDGYFLGGCVTDHSDVINGQTSTGRVQAVGLCLGSQYDVSIRARANGTWGPWSGTIHITL